MIENTDKGDEHMNTPVDENELLSIEQLCDRLFISATTAYKLLQSGEIKEKGGTHRMNFEFMTIDTPLPLCMPFPRALTGFPVSSTAKVMYCRMLDAMLSKGQEDENGILFVCFPVTAIAAVLSRSPMTVKRSLNELEIAGLIMRVRQGVGEPNRIYVLIPGKEDAALA